MSQAENREAAERATEEAFARSGWRDPRADYRALLKRLREQDSAAFDEAVRQYEAGVVGPVAAGTADPVRAWLDFGHALAAKVGHGRTVGIDADGRAIQDAQLEVDRPLVLLHLPADEGTAALPIAVPREPSAAQEAALALLAEGRQALPG